MHALETLHKNGYRVKIYQDVGPIDPRKDYSQFSTMVCDHDRYNLGDRKLEENESRSLSRGGWALLCRYLRRFEGMIAIEKIGLLDHSGLHMYVGGGANRFDPGGWDSGTVGFAYVTRASYAEAMGDGEIDLDHAYRIIKEEIEEYDQYLRGDVYGFVIETPDGEHVDSCWGFYGFDYCKEEALSEVPAAKPKRFGVHVRPSLKLYANTVKG